MKRMLIGALILLGLQSAAFADVTTIDANELGAMEKVRSIPTLGGLHDFDSIDDATLIVWRTPFEPYLVELAFPSVDLKFAHAIAVESHLSQIHKFDSVLIRGMSYPIANIYKLSRDQAKELRNRT